MYVSGEGRTLHDAQAVHPGRALANTFSSTDGERRSITYKGSGPGSRHKSCCRAPPGQAPARLFRCAPAGACSRLPSCRVRSEGKRSGHARGRGTKMARQFRGRRGYSWSGAVWDWAGVGFWMGSEGRLGIGNWGWTSPTRSPEHPESGQRTAASSVSNRGRAALDLGAMAHWAPGIQWGERVRSLQCDVRSTNQEMRQSRKQAPGNPTLFRQTVRNHNHDRNTPSPFHVLFSCWRIGDGITALQPLEEEGGSLSPPAPPPRGPPPLPPPSRQDPSTTIALLHHPNASVCNLREG